MPADHEGDGSSAAAGGPGLRVGVRIGVDVGDVRIGVARSDPQALVATPVETVKRGPGDLARIVDLVEEYAAVEVVVGLARSLSGAHGPAATKTTAFAVDLAAALSARGLAASTRLVDERLTTVSAERVLREQGRRGPRRREVVDQAAAVVILQHAMDSERSTGRPPGEGV